MTVVNARARLFAAALGSLGLVLLLQSCGGEEEFVANVALVEFVEEALEEVESFRIEAPGPSGNGSEPSDWTIEFIRPDRMRQTIVYRGEEDCPRQIVYLGGNEYRRDPCDDPVWRGRAMSAEDLQELERFYLFPENIVVATLDALIDPRIRRETMLDGTEVIVASGMVNYQRFISHLPSLEPKDEGSPRQSETPAINSAEITLLADSHLPLELVFDVPNEGSFAYRFSDYDSVPPIEVPAPTPTPRLTPLPTPIGNIDDGIQGMRDIEIEPYWLGERFDGPGGLLILPGVRGISIDAKPAEGAFSYALEDGVNGFDLSGALTIRLRPAGAPPFEPPEIPPRGPKPEREEMLIFQGQEATLFTSLLEPEGLPCPAGTICTWPDVPLYHRLVLTLGGTAIEVRALGRFKPEEDINTYNNREALIAVANALVLAE